MSGYNRDRFHRQLMDYEERLRRREDMLDRWERDLRSREDSLSNAHSQRHRVPRSYPPRAQRVRRPKDYAVFAAEREEKSDVN